MPDATETIKGISSYSNVIDYIDSKFNRFFTKIFPIGTIYTTTSSTFDPNVTFGGTWERYAKGRTLMGVDANDVNFNIGEKTGGSQTTTLSVGNLPSHIHNAQGSTDAQGNHYHVVNDHAHYVPNHSHLMDANFYNEKGLGGGAIASGGPDLYEYRSRVAADIFGGECWTHGSAPATNWAGQHSHWFNVNTSATGSNQAFSNLNPYITVYFWKRTK